MTLLSKCITTLVYLFCFDCWASIAKAQVNPQIDSTIQVVDENQNAIGHIVIDKSNKIITTPDLVNTGRIS